MACHGLSKLAYLNTRRPEYSQKGAVGKGITHLKINHYMNPKTRNNSCRTVALQAAIIVISLCSTISVRAQVLKPACGQGSQILLIHAIDCLNDDGGTASKKLNKSAKGRAKPVNSNVHMAEPPRGLRRISMSFSDVDVRDVLGQVSEYSGMDIILTPGATGKITIGLRNRMADEAIRLIAAAAGLGVARTEGTYIVGPAAELQKATAEVGTSEFVPLQYLSPLEAMGTANRLAPRVRTEEAKGGVVISGLPQDLQAAHAALLRMDVRPVVKPETSVVNLQATDPADAEKMLHEAFPELKVVRQSRTLVLTGTQGELQAASR